MTKFEKLKSMNEEEISEFLDSIISIDDNPWIAWFNKRYCKNCKTIRRCARIPDIYYDFTYCEVNGICKYFQDKDDIPDNKEMIELWLESEEE